MSYWEIADIIDELSTVIGTFMKTYWILLLLTALGAYIFKGYMYMCIGKKADVEDDWMPFLAIARQLYMIKIADRPWWNIFLFSESGFITVTITVLVGWILGRLTKSLIFVGIVLAVYWIAILIFTFFIYRNFYSKFRFNPNTAWLVIIPGLGIVDLVFKMLVAFSDVVVKRTKLVDPPVPPIPSKRATIIGISGQYEGAVFDISRGDEIAMGRSAKECHIVFDQFQEEVSRIHCKIRYDLNTEDFYITDCSSLGTYMEDGTRLENGVTKRVGRGTVIYLATKRNKFRLDLE